MRKSRASTSLEQAEQHFEGCNTPWRQPTIKNILRKSLHEQIMVAPVPRNMHPEYHLGRRKARAITMERRYGTLSTARWTDAAMYPNGEGMVISVAGHRQQELVSASVRTQNVAAAEEAAIALAISASRQNEELYILTDCQSACRAYANGHLHKIACDILHRLNEIPRTTIIWTPGHEGVSGNHRAHTIARGHCNRALQETPEDPSPDTLQTYYDILQHYRLSRRTMPPPHPSLTRAEATTWRQLQTNTYPHLTLLHAMYPTLYQPLCPFCTERATLYHTTWACQNIPNNSPNRNATHEQWEMVLTSSALEDQRKLIARAESAATAAGALD